MSDPVYLDHNATTPVAAEVAEAIEEERRHGLEEGSREEADPAAGIEPGEV